MTMACWVRLTQPRVESRQPQDEDQAEKKHQRDSDRFDQAFTTEWVRAPAIDAMIA